MAHLTDGTLRRMVDDPDARAGSDAAHLETCSDCKARFGRISEDAHSVATLLAVPAASVDAASAFQKVRGAPAASPRFGIRLPIARVPRRPLMLALVAAIVGVALLGTVVAKDMKTNYSPSTVQTVPVTVADLQALSQLADYGTITWTKQPDLQVATSAGDAASVSGIKPPVVSNLPPNFSTNITYGAMPQAQAVFTFDANKAAAAAAAHGKTLPALPKGMDGAKLTVTAGPAVGEIYGDFNKPSSNANDFNLPQLIVGESAAPSVTSTQVTVPQLENYILQQPGISPELAAAIRSIKHPDRTLVIPIPVKFATSKDVTVQGVQGVALGDNTGVGSGVIWVKNGMVFVVAGSIKQSDALTIANNLK
ncbi:MAG TPA: hypothetical protein VNA65_07815 [Candidatus Dormibacteraeota bacterium]|nr:hypothetical protein [Candidatus Dormibacteraeota bacterium]